ncbi:hypothetical protein POM88_011397 [Heracleum sosnowskyi]|uniref:Helitron helicase-like domain-containing protein n=1 Tax=Heracleum sosnowskyi TaxID=360622 RepID=A0AAD8N169_9APIA|nr:hypothetical protein POM88_011397 [Heracleum sosnowskyi]
MKRVEDTNPNFRSFYFRRFGSWRFYEMFILGPKKRLSKKRRVFNKENVDGEVHVTSTSRFPNICQASTTPAKVSYTSKPFMNSDHDTLSTTPSNAKTDNTEHLLYSTLPWSDITNLPCATTCFKKHPKGKIKCPIPDMGKRLFHDEENSEKDKDDAHIYNEIEYSKVAGDTSSDDDIFYEEDIVEDDDSCEQNLTDCMSSQPYYQSNSVNGPREYKSLGAPMCTCEYCGAVMWKEERVNKGVTCGKPKFSICCSKGKIQLPRPPPTPGFLLNLYNDKAKDQLLIDIKQKKYFGKCVGVMYVVEFQKRGLPHVHIFDLFDFEDLLKIYKDNRFLVDVVGFIDFVQGKTVYTKGNEERSHIKFEITNGRMNVKVTFFGTLGDDFQRLRREIVGDNVIIIIASAKANEWDDKINLTNYPATRFYLNADHYSVKELMAKSKDPSFAPKNDFEHEEEIKYITTVKDIQNLKDEYSQKKVTCAISVRKVETNYNWFYKKCTKCEEEVSLVGGNYTCKTCGRNILFPNKRFRILTLCSDETGSIPVIFPDHEIRKLVGKNNIKKVCDAYNAVEIKPLQEAVSGSALFETDDEANHDSSMITVIILSVPNESLTSPDDTPTAKSSGTKAKGRKIMETVEGSDDIPTKDMNNNKKGRGNRIHRSYSHHTNIEKLTEDDPCIDTNAFDFYDLADIKDLANLKIFLIDVIGFVIIDEPEIIKFTNKFGMAQKNSSFRSLMAEYYRKQLLNLKIAIVLD